MNGRVYDPEIGRFLSADPFVQYPESTQGYNRYTYVGNNPLSYVDPSGFSFWKKLMMVVGIVMSIWMPQFQFLWQKLLWTFASGYLQSGGDVRSGFIAVGMMGLRLGLSGMARGPPAGVGTPPINPSGLAFAAFGEAAETAADRTFQDQLAEFFRRAIRVLVANDASRQTNQESKSASGNAVDTDSFRNVTWLAIVLHRTGGSSVEGALATMERRGLGVNFVIGYDGVITGVAPLDQRPSHVGLIRARCMIEGSCAADEVKAIKAMGWNPRGVSRREIATKSYPARYPISAESIGIEVVGRYDQASGTWEAATEAQNASVKKLVTQLQVQYGLTNSDVYAHSAISYKQPGEGEGLGY